MIQATIRSEISETLNFNVILHANMLSSLNKFAQDRYWQILTSKENVCVYHLKNTCAGEIQQKKKERV